MVKRRTAFAADPVTSAMLAKLATSLLDEQDAAALMMGPADPKELLAAGFPNVAAFELPYFDAKGRPTGFKRWRYLEDTRSTLERKTERKPLRYVQAGGSVTEAYLPPLADWAAAQADTKVPLVVTEGELKAACLTKLGRLCIGLGGVYSFKSVKKKLPLLPVFYEFKWAGRDVVVAYDSDAHTNPMVVGARNELCRELLALGALPRVADVTAGEDGAKRGLDDLALQDGEQALFDVLDAAEPFATAQALHELNAEVAYVRDPGLIVVLADGRRMRASDFTGHAYANRHYHEITVDKDGNEKMAKRKAAQAWLEWGQRLELSSMAYEPGEPRITVDGAYNTWSGWGCEPKRGDIGPWRKLLDFLFKGHPAERKWFEQWCAIPLQNPGVKQYTAAVLWGVRTGTGKSLAGVALGRIYGHNFTLIGDQELQDGKNAWTIGKQFVMGDDVTGQDQRRYADRLKKMITQPEVRVDQKYVPAYTMRDVINYLFTSNHPDAFFLEDDDRRNFVHEVTGSPLPREFYLDEFVPWMEGEGPSALFYHLLRLDLGGRRAEDRAPETAARASMVEDGLSDLGRWARRLRDDPDLCLRLGDAKLDGDLWSATDLVKIYDPEGRGKVTAGGLGRELKRAGFRQVYGGMPVRTTGGQARLFAVRNVDTWAEVKAQPALASHYDTTRGALGIRKKF